MIELRADTLRISFPEVHEQATLRINFQRTLRIPDDNTLHSLPPGLGSYPLRHVDDFADKIPAGWQKHGGVMLPMFQSEALWLNFNSDEDYPMLLKIATGKINAISGEQWTDMPNRDPQDYAVAPDQPWLDGYCVESGEVRQFVAMPLGEGYTAEEQLTGEATHGGIQFVVYPMKAAAWEKYNRDQQDMRGNMTTPDVYFCLSRPSEMGLAPGGRMKQDIADDPHAFDVWDLRHPSRCFVHIANSLNWRAITGDAPPTIPPTAAQYTSAGLPWFDYYSEGEAVTGSKKLGGLKTVKEMGEEKGEQPLPENEGVGKKVVVALKGKVG